MSGTSCASCCNLRWDGSAGYHCRAWSDQPASPDGGCTLHSHALDPDGYFVAYPPTGVARALAEVAVQRAVDAPTSLAGWAKNHWIWWGEAAQADAPLEPAAGDLDTLGGDPPDFTGSTP